MAFLISSKPLESSIDFFEKTEIKEIGSYNVIVEGMKSNTDEGNSLFVKGNIYGEEAPKKVDDIQKIDESSLEKLSGSFTALNIHEDELELFRDYFGSRPVYFLEKKNELFISDRIKPLLNFTEPKPEREMCLDYLHSGLVDHSRKTFFQNIKQLRPREALFYNQDGVEVREINQDNEDVGDNPECMIRDELKKKMPETDFVCPISGGLDSSIIASMATRGEFLHADFDIETGDEAYYNELKQDLGLDVKEVEFGVTDLINFVDEGLEIHEYPTGMLAVQAMQMLHRKVQESERNQIVDGTGADEIFLGYPRFIPYYIDSKFDEGLFQGLKAVKNYFWQLDYHGRRELLRLLTPYSNTFEIPEIDHAPNYDRPENLEEAVEKNFQVHSFPHILVAKDKSAEFHGVETVYPFLSYKFLNWQNLTSNFGDGFTKKPLRDIFGEDLPNKIAGRKKKTGFIHTDNQLFKDDVLEDFEEVFSSEEFQERDIFDGELFYRRFRNDLQSFFKCYRFYSLEKWMRKFID